MSKIKKLGFASFILCLAAAAMYALFFTSVNPLPAEELSARDGPAIQPEQQAVQKEVQAEQDPPAYNARDQEAGIFNAPERSFKIAYDNSSEPIMMIASAGGQLAWSYT